MYGRAKKWKELESFVAQNRKEGVATSFSLKANSETITLVADNKPRNIRNIKSWKTVNKI